MVRGQAVHAEPETGEAVLVDDLLQIVVSEGVRLALTGSAFDANGTRRLKVVGGTWRLHEAV